MVVKVKTDCFAYNKIKNKCNALNKLCCVEHIKETGKIKECSFYKHKDEVDIREIERDINSYEALYKKEEA